MSAKLPMATRHQRADVRVVRFGRQHAIARWERLGPAALTHQHIGQQAMRRQVVRFKVQNLPDVALGPGVRFGLGSRFTFWLAKISKARAGEFVARFERQHSLKHQHRRLPIPSAEQAVGEQHERFYVVGIELQQPLTGLGASAPVFPLDVQSG